MNASIAHQGKQHANLAHLFESYETIDKNYCESSLK